MDNRKDDRLFPGDSLENFRIIEQDATGKRISRGQTRINTAKLRRERERQARWNLVKKAAPFALATMLIAGVGAKTITNKVIDQTMNSIAQIQEDRQKYVYTNLSNDELMSLPFEKECELYEQYIEYVANNAPFFPTGVSPTDNYDYHRSRAHDCINYLNSGMIPDEMVESTKADALNYYQDAIECIKNLYGNKYSFNEVSDDAIVIDDRTHSDGRTL